MVANPDTSEPAPGEVWAAPATARRDQPWSGSGLKVLEVANFVAGPVAATLLGDFGADVIKVERPRSGDPIRNYPPGPVAEGMSYQWRVEGRNKRSITANLKSAAGRQIVLELARSADVFVENAVPGVMDGWGLGYRDLSAINPRLVYVSVTGYGQGNELSGQPGFDYTGAALSGLTHVTGFQNGPPVLPGYAIVDFASATFGALGALEAVRRRDSPGGTRRGEWVDVALFDPLLRFSTPTIPMYALDGVARFREGSVPLPDNDKPGNTFGFVYETSDDRFVAVSPAQHDLTHHKRLMHLVGRADLADDPRLIEYQERKVHYRELDSAVRVWTCTRHAATVVELLRGESIPGSMVNSAREIMEDPVLRQRDVVEVWDEESGTAFPMQGVVPRFVGTPGVVRWPGERLGASNADVYRRLLGWSEDELAKAAADGVI